MVRKSAICHIYGRSTSLAKKLAANLRICELRDLFADRLPLPVLFHLFVGLDTVPFQWLDLVHNKRMDIASLEALKPSKGYNTRSCVVFGSTYIVQ
jgi:hypothetical protein